jgi:hypothetical protein
MVRSTGSPRTITVKRRGSKRYVAEAAGWEGSRRDARQPGSPDRDDPYADPARAEHAQVRAQ